MAIGEAVSRYLNAVALNATSPSTDECSARCFPADRGPATVLRRQELSTPYMRLDGFEEVYRDEAGSTLLNAVPSYLNPRIRLADGLITVQ